jgi:hypothetical protein
VEVVVGGVVVVVVGVVVVVVGVVVVGVVVVVVVGSVVVAGVVVVVVVGLACSATARHCGPTVSDSLSRPCLSRAVRRVSTLAGSFA